MATSVKIISDELLFEGRFRLTRTRAAVRAGSLEYEVTHEVYRFGRAAAVLLYDPARSCVLLVRQFRMAAYLADGTTEMLEACAGMIDSDTPEAAARREAFEETGVQVATIQHAFDAFMSPGGMSEIVSCFLAPYSVADRVGAGGGVDADEHIEIVEIPFAEALAKIDSGEIRDAKTIALLYRMRATGLM